MMALKGADFPIRGANPVVRFSPAVYGAELCRERLLLMEVWGMMIAGFAALVAGLLLRRGRLRSGSATDCLILLAPVFEAVALAMFAAEHFTAAASLLGVVPGWMPFPLFWVYFVGVALLAAAVSFLAARCVRWSALLLALFFLLVVACADVPAMAAQAHERLFWSLFVREISFAGGAMVLAASDLPLSSTARAWLARIGRSIVALVLAFYAMEHFLYPHFAPGVPLQKMTPTWVPAPVLLADMVGAVLLASAIGLFLPRLVRPAAAAAGGILLLLTVFFYGPIFLLEMHTPLAVEGMNYVGDTLLFAATVLMSGLVTE